jgi:hypothetical protein
VIRKKNEINYVAQSIINQILSDEIVKGISKETKCNYNEYKRKKRVL